MFSEQKLCKNESNPPLYVGVMKKLQLMLSWEYSLLKGSPGWQSCALVLYGFLAAGNSIVL